MKINWKARFKNAAWVVSACTLVLAFVYNVLGMFEVVPAISQDSVTNAVLAIVQLLTAAGILVDPTTAGLNDSERALTYYTEHDVRIIQK